MVWIWDPSDRMKWQIYFFHLLNLARNTHPKLTEMKRNETSSCWYRITLPWSWTKQKYLWCTVKNQIISHQGSCLWLHFGDEQAVEIKSASCTRPIQHQTVLGKLPVQICLGLLSSCISMCCLIQHFQSVFLSLTWGQGGTYKQVTAHQVCWPALDLGLDLDLDLVLYFHNNSYKTASQHIVMPGFVPGSFGISFTITHFLNYKYKKNSILCVISGKTKQTQPWDCMGCVCLLMGFPKIILTLHMMIPKPLVWAVYPFWANSVNLIYFS